MESKPPTTEPPTTYVQADPRSFRDLVQRLTGVPSKPSPSAAAVVGPRRQAFKLHDQRGSRVRSLEVKLSLKSPRTAARSPTPSPVTPLVSDPVFSPPALVEEEEERVIKEKGFYLHRSPRGSGPPELLTLFPLCSPKQQQQQQ